MIEAVVPILTFGGIAALITWYWSVPAKIDVKPLAKPDLKKYPPTSTNAIIIEINRPGHRSYPFITFQREDGRQMRFFIDDKQHADFYKYAVVGDYGILTYAGAAFADFKLQGTKLN